MAVATPDWLAKHSGEVREGTGGHAWLVLLNGEPQYRLVPIPASGKHGCQVIQTVNGRHLEGKNTYPSLDDALRGGLEDMRKALGW